MNVLSLFDGMGCGQIALERVGIEVENYFASEIDKYAIKVTQANYPNTKHIGDVTKVKGEDLPKIDLLIGGSPCQGFSFAGKKLNFDDDRSKLFFEFVRILEDVKPKYFLLENVRMKQEWQDIVSKILGVKPININSSLVSPQNRNRLYWTNIPNIGQPNDMCLEVKDFLITDVEEKYYMSEKATKLIQDSLNKRGHSLNTFNVISSWQKNYTISSKKCSAVTAAMGMGGGHVPMITKLPYRKFTPLEIERMQTVPDNYTFGVSDTQRYKMLGNGWTVDVIAHIFKNIPLT
jgi:site-specific DNA-cytosine methylase